MLPITKKISKYNFSKGNNPEYIVIHETGNDHDTDEGNANYFNACYRGASANYFVDDNSITQVVEDYNASYHCGDGGGRYGITNYNSIGIEMCNTSNGMVSATTEANTIELVKHLMQKHNIPVSKVVRHYDASRKKCPSDFAPNNWERWNNFKKKLVNSGTLNSELEFTHYALEECTVCDNKGKYVGMIYKDEKFHLNWVGDKEVNWAKSVDFAGGNGYIKSGMLDAKYKICKIGEESPGVEPPKEPEEPKNYRVVITCKDEAEANLIKTFLATAKVE